MRSNGWKKSSLKCSLPLNIRCSNRWAKPVRLGRSFFEPTWYQMFTATIGALGSSWTSRVRPFFRTNRWYGIVIAAGAARAVGAARAAAGRGRARLARAGRWAVAGDAMASPSAKLTKAMRDMGHLLHEG